MVKSTFKKVFYTFLILVSNHVLGANGDTTIVKVFEDLKITRWGNFDTTIYFSQGKTYKKAIALYTLGKYACPSGTQYCASWDYTTFLYLLNTPSGNLEIGKVITPYATTGSSFSRYFPNSWTHTYPIDISDYSKLLTDSQKIRYKFDGYSFGFILTLNIMLIEGTPARDVKAINKIYSGNYNYGKATTTMNSLLTPQNVQYTPATKKAIVRTKISGHGAYGNSQCSEFCPNKFKVFADTSTIAYNDIWRACGSINIYPQTGTWVFDRGNWCPGERVEDIDNTIPNVMPNGSDSIRLALDQVFTPNDASTAKYLMEAQVIQYGDMNYTNNVTLVNVKNPSTDDQVERDNPSCQPPVINIKNNGSAAITSLEMEYGLSNGTKYNYTYTGTITSEANSTITLPYIEDIRKATNDTTLRIKIKKVNGVSDEDTTDNIIFSKFRKANLWPNKFLVLTFTNSQTTPAGVGENSWSIKRPDGSVAFQRATLSPNTVYRDTLELYPGCYSFEGVDAGCDGMSFWYFQYYNPNPGSGYIRIFPVGGGSQVPLTQAYGGDFGCGFKTNFQIDWPAGTETIQPIEGSIQVFPNPAHTVLNIAPGVVGSKANYKIMDMMGKIVSLGSISLDQLDISLLADGAYWLTIEDNGKTWKSSFVKN